MGSKCYTRPWRAHKKGAFFPAIPVYIQIHPTLYFQCRVITQFKVDTDVGIASEWMEGFGGFPKRLRKQLKNGRKKKKLAPRRYQRGKIGNYYLERKYPSFRNLCTKNLAYPKCQSTFCYEGRGVE